MIADRRIESLPTITPVTHEELVQRAPEYKGLFETEEAAARWMVYRMYYFLSEASAGKMNGLLSLRAAIRDNELEDATNLGQYFYEKEYLSSHLNEPPTILDKLIPTAAEFATIPARRLELKERVVSRRSLELVAEKRLMRMKAWQEQAANLARKIEAGVDNPKKLRRMEEALYNLQRLIRKFEPSVSYF